MTLPSWRNEPLKLELVDSGLVLEKKQNDTQIWYKPKLGLRIILFQNS